MLNRANWTKTTKNGTKCGWNNENKQQRLNTSTRDSM